ncbi:hypothetical protein HDU67_009827 [Dinochytrium kinnereticum]|nr:hypothetical protein HDU67_009827 [Dinochytrium kinnereticum]
MPLTSASLESDRQYISILLEEKADLMARNAELEYRLSALSEQIFHVDQTQLSNHNLLESNQALSMNVQELEGRTERLRLERDHVVSAKLELESKCEHQEEIIRVLTMEIEDLRIAASSASYSHGGETDVQTLTLQESQIESLSNRIDDLSAQLKEKDVTVESLSRYRDECLKKIEDLTSQISVWQDTATAKDNDIEDLKKTIDASNVLLQQDFENEKNRLTEMIAEKNNMIIDYASRIESFETQLREAVETKNSALHKYDGMFKRLASLQGENTQLVEQLGELRSRTVHLSNQLAESSDALFEERKKVKTFSAQLDNYQQALTVVNQIQIPLSPNQEKQPGPSENQLVATLRKMEEDVVTLTVANKKLETDLNEEKKLTTLLAAEVQCLPEYINLYHNERQRLRAKASEPSPTAEFKPPTRLVSQTSSLSSMIGMQPVEYPPCGYCVSKEISL